MACIVAALESHDDVGLLRQPVDDLALSFVAPLSADDDNIGHSRVFPLQLPKHERDQSGEPASNSGSCTQPKSRPGPFACEAYNRIKEAAYRRKQKGALGGFETAFKPLISPENLCRENGSGCT